jgi:hypothetical protein
MTKKTPEQIYEEQERALIGEAIAETEQEIFDEALGQDPAENDADTSLEEMDGEDVLDEDDTEGEDEENEETGGAEDSDTGEQEEETPPARQDDPRDRRGVPPGRLREVSDARRAAEAERDQARAEARELRARMDALEAQPQQRQDDRREQPEVPDLFADPEARLNYERRQIAQEFETRRINASFSDAEETHGDGFRTAFQALQRTGNAGLVSEIVNSNNPGKSLMKWHGRQSLAAEIGDDPAAYRQRVREELLQDPELRRQVITGARNDAMRGDGDGAPRTRTRLPPSLDGATGGTSHRGGNSRAAPRSARSTEQEIFESAFED